MLTVLTTHKLYGKGVIVDKKICTVLIMCIQVQFIILLTAKCFEYKLLLVMYCNRLLLSVFQIRLILMWIRIRIPLPGIVDPYPA